MTYERSPGLLGRLSSLIRGIFGTWLRDSERQNPRAIYERAIDERLRQYDPSWSGEQVIEWDGNFRSDGALMLVCCERDIEIDEYRTVLVVRRSSIVRC